MGADPTNSPDSNVNEWFARKAYDGKDVIIVLAAGVVLGAALTAKKAR